ncbi:restriction endonuclease subunit S [Phocaeicola sp.]|uniref:restriction endonuclease subunit S n=1 Tax=Phocaeicola sp. TaxID=2773926 RepID=UPI0027D24802|nr:restriction endonuclease subunit S [Phocaeicola sp.]
MEQWKQYNIGEICDTISETYKGNASDVVLINTSDVLEGKCLNHTFVANKNLRGQFKKQFKKNDILYSEIRPANKRYAFIDFESTDYIASTKLMVIRSNDKVLPKYLYYVLQSKEMVEVLQMLAESRSGTFPQITFSELAIQTILLPEIREQSKIVDFLESIDSKIALNRRINDNLEQQAQALFKSWFVDFEPFKDGKFVDSEMGMIPEGWKVGKLEDIADVVGGGTPSKANALYFDKQCIPWITPKDLSIKKTKFISKGEIDITEEGYKNSSAKKIPLGSVLFSSRAPIGYISIAENELTTNQGFKSVVPVKAGTSFLYLYLKANTKAIEAQATGSTFKEASGSLMKSLCVIIPPDTVFDSFERNAFPFFSAQANVEREIVNLSKARDTLLPRLMSGELKINDLNC